MNSQKHDYYCKFLISLKYFIRFHCFVLNCEIIKLQVPIFVLLFHIHVGQTEKRIRYFKIHEDFPRDLTRKLILRVYYGIYSISYTYHLDIQCQTR